MNAHPAAAAFPLMDADHYANLLEDIRVNGQRVPIVLCDAMVLDGRNRLRACEELGVPPSTQDFDGDPWGYVWSLNGSRRDLVAEQRYLIWKLCVEHSAQWEVERARIASEANTKRSAATRAQPRNEDGTMADGPVVGHIVPAPDEDAHKGKAAKAALAGVNAGAVARGDHLAKERPDLAEKVRNGESTPAFAHREMKRAQVVAALADTAAAEIARPTGKHDVIVIDPPWQMEKIERDVHPDQVGFDYPTMGEEELAALDVGAMSADSCHLFCWTTQKYLPMALRLIPQWGFKYVLTMVWHKRGGFQPFGLPQFNCEFAVYARKGAPEFIDTKAFPCCFDGARREHSRKPDEFYDLIRRVTGGRRVDVFSREARDGFAQYGNEPERFVA